MTQGKALTMNEASSSQKLMVFVLSMSIYGLATLFTELLPTFNVGPVEFSVEYFLFIPLTLAMLLDPLSAALGAATGEVIFSEIMLGQFGGIGEIEKFLRISLAVYLAGKLINDPQNRTKIALAALLAVVVDLAIGTLVDITKVQIGVEDFEAVEGLAESVWVTEGFAFFNDLLFSGILFVIIPTTILVPRLHGKIEPLLGMEPRRPDNYKVSFGPKAFIGILLAVAGAFLFEILSESNPLVDWEAPWAGSNMAIAIALVVAAVIALIAILILRNMNNSQENI